MILIHHVSDGKRVYSHILLSFEILYFFHENISRCHNRWCNALYLKLILVSNAMMLCPLSEICVGIHSNDVVLYQKLIVFVAFKHKYFITVCNMCNVIISVTAKKGEVPKSGASKVGHTHGIFLCSDSHLLSVFVIDSVV